MNIPERYQQKLDLIRKTLHDELNKQKICMDQPIKLWKTAFARIYEDQTLTLTLYQQQLDLLAVGLFLVAIRVIKIHSISSSTKFQKDMETVCAKLKLPSYYRIILQRSAYFSFIFDLCSQYQDFNINQFDFISYLHQSQHITTLKHTKGEFYTDPKLAAHMVSNSYHSPQWVLDPSCGTGIFLVALMNFIRELPLSEEDQLQAMERIIGFEINPLTAVLARLNLLIHIPPALFNLFEPQVFQMNTLFGSPPPLSNFDFHFDLIVGNPPWLVLNRIRSTEEKRRIKALGNAFGILEGGNLATSTELTTIFIYVCLARYLKPKGILFFVTPASLATGTQHQLFRQFAGMQNIEIWAFNSDHYRIHNICFKAQKSNNSQINSQINLEKRTQVVWKELVSTPSPRSKFRVEREQIYGPAYIKTIPSSNPNPKKMVFTSNEHNHADKSFLRPNPNIKIGKLVPLNVSPASHIDTDSSSGTADGSFNSPLIFPYQKSPYRDEFRQGASLVPRNLLFVDIISSESDESAPSKDSATLVEVQPSRYIRSKKYSTWDFTAFSTTIVERSTLFQVAKSTGLLPFIYYQPYTTFLPLEKENTDIPHLPPLNLPYGQQHYEHLERLYGEHKKKAAKITNLVDRLNYGNALLDPRQYEPLKVIYAGIGSIVKAAVIHEQLIIDTSLYFYIPDSLNEAYYLVAYLNSSVLTEQVKLVGSTGASGSLRNIHKHPFNFKIPKFNSSIALHRKIAQLGKTMEAYVHKFIESTIAADSKLREKIKALQNRIFKNINYQQLRDQLDKHIITLMQENSSILP